MLITVHNNDLWAGAIVINAICIKSSIHKRNSEQLQKHFFHITITVTFTVS